MSIPGIHGRPAQLTFGSGETRNIIVSCLVVYHGIPTPLKNDGVRQFSWDDDIPD